MRWRPESVLIDGDRRSRGRRGPARSGMAADSQVVGTARQAPATRQPSPAARPAARGGRSRLPVPRVRRWWQTRAEEPCSLFVATAVTGSSPASNKAGTVMTRHRPRWRRRCRRRSQPAERAMILRCGDDGAQRFVKLAGRFSTKAAMPSFWSSVANRAWKTPPLEADALGQRRLVGAVDALLGHHDDRQRHAGDRLGRLHRLVEQVGGGHDAARPGRRARPRRRPSCGRSGTCPWPWPCRRGGSGAACRRRRA